MSYLRFIAFVVLCGLSAPAIAQPHPSTDTAFTFQGTLDESNTPADGEFDFIFRLFDRVVGGTELAPSLMQTLEVSDGLFNAVLDFGASPLQGREYYLEIEVGPKDQPTFVLSPRQRIRPAPAAIQAGGANIDDFGFVTFLRDMDAYNMLYTMVENDPLGGKADDFNNTMPFWQSFTALYDAVFGGGAVLVKRPNLDPPPNWALYEGEGIGGTQIASGSSYWGVHFGSNIYFLYMDVPQASKIQLDTGQQYSFTFDSSQISFSEVPIAAPGAERSSSGPSIASIFGIEVRELGKPIAQIGPNGDLRTRSVMIGEDFGLLPESGSLFVRDAFPTLRIADTGAGGAQIYTEFQASKHGPTTHSWQLLAYPTSLRLTHNDGISTHLFEYDDADGRVWFRPETLGLNSSALHENEKLVIESGDAGLGLYSNGSGSFGSFIAMGEVNGSGNLVDKWSIGRRTNGFNIELQFAYGTDPVYSNNQIRFALRPDGSAWLQGSLQQNSSASQKHDIETLRDSIDTLLALRGVSYTWNETGKPDIGFIAEEMARVLPEIVGLDEQGNAIGIDYGRLTALIVEATKDQQRQLDEQRRLIDDLSTRLRAIEHGHD